MSMSRRSLLYGSIAMLVGSVAPASEVSAIDMQAANGMDLKQMARTEDGRLTVSDGVTWFFVKPQKIAYVQARLDANGAVHRHTVVLHDGTEIKIAGEH